MFRRAKITETSLEAADRLGISIRSSLTAPFRPGADLILYSTMRLEIHSRAIGHNLPRAMGAFSYSRSPLHSTVSVGRYCSIGREVTITLDTHPVDWASSSPVFYDTASPYLVNWLAERGAEPLLKPFPRAPKLTTIGNDVWIGSNSIIMSGLTIGDGAIIATGAVVTRDVPPYTVVGGVPARVIRPRFEDALAQRLVAARWWRYGPDVLMPLGVNDTGRFIDQIEAVISEGRAPELKPEALTADDFELL